MPSREQTKAEQEETRRRLLAAEAALLLLLLRATRRSPASGDLRSDADALHVKLAEAYLYGRASAAYAGSDRARAEILALAGTGYVAGQPALELLEEARRAKRAADGYVKRWLDKALGLARDGAELPGPAAHEALAPVLETGAATEAAEAFNAARREIVDDAVRRTPALAQQLEQVWDAELDKRTCDTCSGLDGTTAPLGERFPDGDPPLHPRCRCSISVQPRG